MNSKISHHKILKGCVIDANQIYRSKSSFIDTNETEIQFRSKVAKTLDGHPLLMVERSHSVEVMDDQVKSFLELLPKDCNILDIGGCWGWHWRKLHANGYGATIFIVDFVYENLLIARKLLSDLVGSENIFLVCADATSLPFDDGLFDAIWSVQCFQHIRNIEQALIEANRVLLNGGLFMNFSLNYQPPIRLIYSIFDLQYSRSQVIDEEYYLARSSNAMTMLIEKIFRGSVTHGWSEIIFKPELLFFPPGREGSILGKLDSRLSKIGYLFKWIARQQSTCVRKNVV